MRTRKWAFVAQEAIRFADLGLAPVEIATRLGVKRTTVQRWMAAGKLRDTRRNARGKRLPSIAASGSPSAWAAAVRREYALDATDDQLVTLAESALVTALNPLQPKATQLSAMARFQGLVKQLALVARSADVPAETPKPAPAVKAAARQVQRSAPAVDPRRQLMTVVK